MRYQPRAFVAGRPHQIYLRGNNRRLLFASRADRVLWIDCVRHALDATTCLLHQMTLLRSSVRAVITPPHRAALSDMVKRACGRYGQTRNKLRGGSGRLFAVGFPAIPLVDDDEVKRATLYADTAAMRANGLGDPFAHEWSTVRFHAGLASTHVMRAVWTPSPCYTRLAAGANQRAAAYRQAVIELVALGDLPDAFVSLEQDDALDYRRRIERPDGTWAREGQLQYGRKPLRRRAVGG
jgi:hypothetical protein